MGRDRYDSYSCCNICGCNPCRCNLNNSGYGKCDKGNYNGPAYATFCAENLEQTICRGDSVRFDKGSNCSEGIKLVRGGRRGRDRYIEVCDAGVYYISYIVYDQIDMVYGDPENINHQVCVYVNDLMQDCSKGGIIVPNPEEGKKVCGAITGSLVVCLQACSEITLKNCSPNGPGDCIHFCPDLGIEASISIFKIC